MTHNVTVRNNTDARLYDAIQEGKVVGSLSYERLPGRVVLVHTFVDPQKRGLGIASMLTRFALNDIRAQNLTVTPLCEFVVDYVGQHPEYAGLVDPRFQGGVAPSAG